MPFDATNFGDDRNRRDLAILRAARAELVKPGNWAKGTFENDGARCAVGWVAWAQVRFEVFGFEAAAELLFDHLPPWWRHNPDHCDAVTNYNDWPLRARSTIVRLFDRAIAAREAELVNA